MPTNDTFYQNPQEAARNTAYDPNMFGRTPEARWYASKASARSAATGYKERTEVSEALEHAYEQFPVETETERSSVSEEEMRTIVQHVLRTNQLLEWFRTEEMGGRR